MARIKSTPKRKFNWLDLIREIKSDNPSFEIIQQVLCKRCRTKITDTNKDPLCHENLNLNPIPAETAPVEPPLKDLTAEQLCELLDIPRQPVCYKCQLSYTKTAYAYYCISCRGVLPFKETSNESKQLKEKEPPSPPTKTNSSPTKSPTENDTTPEMLVCIMAPVQKRDAEISGPYTLTFS